MNESDGRDRGVLSPQDREFLRGERDHISQGAKYNTQRRIRQRIENSLLDFALLFRQLDESEREKVADAINLRGEARAMGGPMPPPNAMSETLSFLYLLHSGPSQFEMSVYRALLDATRASESDLLFQRVSVDVDIEAVERPDIVALKEQIQEDGVKSLSDIQKDFLFALLARTGDETLTAFLDSLVTPADTHPSNRPQRNTDEE